MKKTVQELALSNLKESMKENNETLPLEESSEVMKMVQMKSPEERENIKFSEHIKNR